MTNTLCVQRKFIFDRSNLSRCNSVPNYTPDCVILPYFLFNNLFSFSSTIIFDSALIISCASIVPIISGPSIVPSSNIPAIVPSSNGHVIVPSSNGPNISSAVIIPAAVIPVPVIPNTSSIPHVSNVSNSLANSQTKNTQYDSIVNLSKDDKMKSKTPKLSITEQIKDIEEKQKIPLEEKRICSNIQREKAKEFIRMKEEESFKNLELKLNLSKQKLINENKRLSMKRELSNINLIIKQKNIEFKQKEKDKLSRQIIQNKKDIHNNKMQFTNELNNLKYQDQEEINYQKIQFKECN
jgi:hypothetical protein